MATSSIKSNFIISGTREIETFIRAFEDSENAPYSIKSVSARQVTDKDEIRKIMQNRKKYHE